MKEISLRDYLEQYIAELRSLRSVIPCKGHIPETIVGEYGQILLQIEEAGIDVTEFAYSASPTEREGRPTADADSLTTRLDWAVEYLEELLARNPKEISLLLPDDE